MMRMQERWHRLIPSYYKIQYAGNMGLLSFGTGWTYGKNRQWETDLFIGFIPKYESDKVKVTLTVKQNFIPWKLDVSKYFSFEPLACGIYLNTILSNQFWVRQPERYPKGYYWFATKLRPNIYIGQRFTFNISPDKRFIAKAITVFYEISTCDYYILSHIGNSGYPLHDIISLSFNIPSLRLNLLFPRPNHHTSETRSHYTGIAECGLFLLFHKACVSTHRYLYVAWPI